MLTANVNSTVVGESSVPLNRGTGPEPARRSAALARRHADGEGAREIATTCLDELPANQVPARLPR